MSKYTSPPKIFDVSRVFQHGKTQIPRDVRIALKLQDGDKIIWFSDGTEIFVKKVE